MADFLERSPSDVEVAAVDSQDGEGPSNIRMKKSSRGKGHVEAAGGSVIGGKKTSEALAYEALAQDMDEWIVYEPGEDLDLWLKENRPSVISREDHIGWIAMTNELDEGVVGGDLGRLHRDWAAMINESKNDPLTASTTNDGDMIKSSNIDFHSICRLAQNCGVMSGKWLFYVQTGLKVDILWRKVCEEMVGTGVLAHVAISAKVSPAEIDLGGKKSVHVVCVYTRDYSDFTEVCRLETALRAAGVKTQLKFKPDVYTHLSIYVNNEWGIRPTIYESHYDVLKKKSKVTRLYDTTTVGTGSTECL